MIRVISCRGLIVPYVAIASAADFGRAGGRAGAMGVGIEEGRIGRRHAVGAAYQVGRAFTTRLETSTPVVKMFDVIDSAYLSREGGDESSKRLAKFLETA
jgi:hypothetical protein